MGSTAKKLMECNSLDDDGASDVKEFYVLLFFLIACCTFFLTICVSISFFFFPCVCSSWGAGDQCWVGTWAWHGVTGAPLMFVRTPGSWGCLSWLKCSWNKQFVNLKAVSWKCSWNKEFVNLKFPEQWFPLPTGCPVWISPTSLSSCAHVDFSREKSGRGRGRFYCGAVFYVTLQQCLFPLGKSKWWIPCGDCRETLITVAYSPPWLTSCHFKSLFHSLDLFVWEVSYIIKANSLPPFYVFQPNVFP